MMCSLRFENASSEAVNCLMRDHGKSVPSFKFLPLFYQIASRLSTERDMFHEVLSAQSLPIASSCLSDGN